MIGRTISHYKILEKLGEGGMGVVYKAEDTKLKRTVALKFLSPHLIGGENERSRFVHEAQSAAGLDHPNICTIHEIDTGDDHIFIAMAYVPGESLQNHIEKGPLKLDEAMRLALDLCGALEESHSKDVLHRDIKPANVVVSEKGHAVVLDFGLAMLKGRTRLTREGTTLGTVNYMSPEQAQGGDIDHRTDIWSVGVVLYQMITGLLPFKGDHEAAIVYSILNEAPEPITGLRTGVPVELERIIHKALSKNPDERYQHIGDLRVDIANLKRSMAATPSVQPSLADPGQPGFVSTAGRQPPSSQKGFRHIAWLLLIALLVFSAIWLFPRVISRDDGGPGKPAARSAGSLLDGRQTSIAVLPLTNLSGDEENEFFVDGMTEEIITQLAQISALKVISRTSVMRYKDTNLPIAIISTELNVATILEGSVLWADNRVRINAQLIDGATDEHLWARSYESDLGDVLGLQRRVAKDVARKIKVELTAQEVTHLAASPAVNRDAYELYLKGRYWWNKRTREDIHKAIDSYNDALKIDRDYAAAYAGLGECYLVLGTWAHWTPPGELFPVAREYAEKALSIDQNLAAAHAVLAGVAYDYEWDWENAEIQFRQALDINPNDVTVHQWCAEFLMRIGRQEEAVQHIETARELDPLSLVIIAVAIYVYAHADNREKSMEAFQEGMDIDPNYPPLFWTLAYALFYFGEFDKAMEAGFRYFDLTASTDIERAAVAEGKAAFNKEGWRGAMRVSLRHLKFMYSASYASCMMIAGYHAALGETDSSLVWLERGYRVRDPGMAQIAEFTVFDSLHDNPRFIELLKRMKLDHILDSN